jgi:flagellar protein FlaG
MVVANQVNNVVPVAANTLSSSVDTRKEKLSVPSAPVTEKNLTQNQNLFPHQQVETEDVLEDITEQQLNEALSVVEQALTVNYSYLKIRFHEEAGRYQVTKVDQETQEVIREIPPERLLKLAAMIREKLAEALGLLVDETV